MQDETVEEEVTEEIKEEVIEPNAENAKELKSDVTKNYNEKELITEQAVSVVQINDDPVKEAVKLSFDDVDYVKDSNDNVTPVSAPKTIEFLNDLSEKRAKEKVEHDDGDKISILPDSFDLTELDVHDIGEPKIKFPELNEEIEFELLD